MAQKALFWKDRNPQVILEAPAPVQEKPAPPLPVLYGVMDIGDGPILMMSEKGAARHRGVRVGETIGEYKLAALEGEALVLNWEGKTVRKKREELAPKKDDAPPVAADTGRPAPVVTSTPSAPSQSQSPAKSEPGVELTAGVKACIPGDTSPAGTVVDGYKKIVTPTPFGNQCRWEAVK
ncbi:MAG: hypothetical protein HY013_02095 [Candidatus Solibacter usitatus]|nr:hypothetical protein [Candidatus Solibacter usitatus]